MKQLFLFGLLMTVAFFSCRKSDIETVKTVSLTVQVGYNAEDSALGLPKSNLPVKITNLISGQDYTANTNNEGIAVFASIAPSSYTISVANNLTAEQYLAITGIYTSTNVAFNATATEAVNVNSNIKLQLISGKIGDLVFKQIYYAGSNASTGAVFRDQFIEIYNNSNQIIYLDSLYVGSTFCSNKTIASGGLPFDWTKSLGMLSGIGDVNKDYLYFRYLFMIPGNGKQYPINPGKSAIIAQTAINHSQPYTGNDGIVVGITNPALTVDLSNADFETNLIEYDKALAGNPVNYVPWKYDLDNPNVKNVEVLIASGNDWIMDNNSRDDFIMFKAKNSPVDWKRYPDPSVTTVTAGTDRGLQVPISVNIIDAVELITPLESARINKRLSIALDAVGTFVTGARYSSQSLIRKTVKTVEGRRILQDTNNSANDFETKTKADPSKTDASFLK